MTYSYDLATNIGKVRLHINDTVSATPKLTDEELTYALSLGGSVGGGVVEAIQFLMVRVADPNFTADWLTVDNASAFKSLQTLLNLKRAEFGIAGIRATTGYAWRPDSRQTEAPTFTDFDLDGDDDDD